MFYKNTDIDVDSKQPFLADKLDRSIPARNLTHLLRSTTQPFVLSVEAPWGWGKTTFIRMWKAGLEAEGNHCLYFNAWANDFVEDPLVAFISEMKAQLEGEKAEEGTPLREKWETLKRVGARLVRRALPLAIRIATQGVLTQDAIKDVAEAVANSGDDIAGFAADLAEEQMKRYESEKQGIQEFKRNLAAFAQLLADNPQSKRPVVFFVDELDRCRPTYAVSLLERIKHVFDVEGVVFVLALDRDQLRSSVRAIYGSDMDADGYLRRFIDLSFRLPAPKTDIFCRYLAERFNLREAFQNRELGAREMDLLLSRFIELATGLGFSLRVQEQCFIEFNLVLRTTAPRYRLYPEFLAFLERSPYGFTA